MKGCRDSGYCENNGCTGSCIDVVAEQQSLKEAMNAWAKQQCADEDAAAAPKETNPKDAVGTNKVPWSVIPLPVLGEVGLAMLEGARKYGRHNYRAAGVRASVYFDAVVGRHLAAWWEGEDMDGDSGLSHITKAIAGLVVLRDSMMQENWVDDRPPPSKPGWLAGQNAKAAAIIEKYPDAKPAHIAGKCEGCETNLADPPSRLCPGCQAYREHQS